MTAQTIEKDESQLRLLPCEAYEKDESQLRLLPCETYCQADSCDICKEHCLDICRNCQEHPQDDHCPVCREWCETDCVSCALPDEEAGTALLVLLAGYVNAGLGPRALYRCPDCAYLTVFGCVGPLLKVPDTKTVLHLCETNATANQPRG